MQIINLEDLSEIADIDCEFVTMRGKMGNLYCAKRNVYLRVEPCPFNCPYFLQRLDNRIQFIGYENIEQEEC